MGKATFLFFFFRKLRYPLYANQEPKFNSVSFNQPYEGTVLDNTTFYETGKIKVYVPHLFVGLSGDLDMETLEALPTKLVQTRVPVDSQVKFANYLECYPFVLNGLPLGSMMPDIGDTVTVFFPQGDPKLAYYINGYRLKEAKDLDKPRVRSEYDDYSAYAYYRILKVKNPPMTGRDVFTVGKKLAHLGYKVTMVDDEYQYNSEMETAIREFQESAHIKVDGKVGPLTYTTLMRRKHKVIKESKGDS